MFDEYYHKYFIKGKIVQRIARKYAGSDEDLYEDLVQEALMRLWELEPERASSNLDSWVRQALRNAIIDYLRKNNPRQYESLDARLLTGEQLERDAATGDLRLISTRRPRLLDLDRQHHQSDDLAALVEESGDE
jgi:RNA polymerase sigma factor (sigma-70 family)